MFVKGRILSASRKNKFLKLIVKAVIPVAELVVHILTDTKAIPKELLPIYDRPMIEYVFKEATENHFNTNYELKHRLNI